MKNKFFAAAAVLLIILQTAGVFCASNGKFIQNCFYETNQIKIICSDMDLNGDLPAADRFNVTLSGDNTAVNGVSTTASEGIPKTIYCLVDISSSMWPEQTEQVKAVLNSINEGLSEGDNIAVCTMGDVIEEPVFLTDKTEITAVIDKIQSQDVATNLYKGIDEGLRQLQTNSNVNSKCCLIIFSDGADYQETGITLSEAENAVNNSSIPVYTVATIRKNASEAQIENSKLLGSFARMSSGGKHYNPTLDGISGESIGQDIISRLNSGIILTVGVEQVKENMDTLLLRVAYSDGASNNYEDTLNIYKEDIDIVVSTEAETETEAETQISETEGAGLTGKVIIGVSAAAVILIIVIFVLIKSKKKNKAEEIPVEAEKKEDSEKIIEETVSDENLNSSEPDPRAEADYSVRFSIIGREKLSKTIYIKTDEPVIIGSAPSAVSIISNDNKLAENHCMLVYNKGKLRIKDLGSGTDTYVNGVSVSKIGAGALNNGDTVRIGGYEYRVYCEKV